METRGAPLANIKKMLTGQWNGHQSNSESTQVMTKDYFCHTIWSGCEENWKDQAIECTLPYVLFNLNWSEQCNGYSNGVQKSGMSQ